MASRATVTFLPCGTTVEIEAGSTVLDAASRAGLLIPAPCGGRGSCGRCAVTVESGELAEPEERELTALARARVEPGLMRLACMAQVGTSPVTLRVRSLNPLALDAAAGRPHRQRTVAAVDLGTTTVSAVVLDPATRERLGEVTVPNRQMAHGADVLSRLSATLEGNGEQVRDAAETSSLEAIELACVDAGVPASSLRRVVFAANTAMLSLLAGADVGGLATHPFRHALSDPVVIRSQALAEAYPGADLFALPPVAGFVGGDLVAGLIAEGLAEGADGVAYLDIGTNAEIAVLRGESASITSAPAGPAFEGWGIACGGLADAGGIVAVNPGDGQVLPVTGGGSATHLTGSGLLSAVALLRENGHLAADGLLSFEGRFADAAFVLPDGVRAISLSGTSGVLTPYISQLDVRAFQYAKAAVGVALKSCLADTPGRAPSEYVLAGAFGGALAEKDLLACGVLPRDAAGRTRHAGNAALEGAAAVALEPDMLEVARAFVVRATHVDLAAESSFSERFVGATALEPYSL